MGIYITYLYCLPSKYFTYCILLSPKELAGKSISINQKRSSQKKWLSYSIFLWIKKHWGLYIKHLWTFVSVFCLYFRFLLTYPFTYLTRVFCFRTYVLAKMISNLLSFQAYSSMVNKITKNLTKYDKIC